MKIFNTERVLNVHHWNDNLFSFKTTRSEMITFKNGNFVMVGLEISGKPLMRAYSMVSANYEKNFEFFSVKLDTGILTSLLRNIKIGDSILIGRKYVGTLVINDLKPGENLYLFSTGTGLAPFLSIIKDIETYKKFKKIILIHSVRRVNDLAYANFIRKELPYNALLGRKVKEKLIYYPTVTREKFSNQGRITELIRNGKIFSDLDLSPLNQMTDRAMICGNPNMLKDISQILNERGFRMSSEKGDLGDYVVEKAFVRK